MMMMTMYIYVCVYMCLCVSACVLVCVCVCVKGRELNYFKEMIFSVFVFVLFFVVSRFFNLHNDRTYQLFYHDNLVDSCNVP